MAEWGEIKHEGKRGLISKLFFRKLWFEKLRIF
jgi:hypothetical protein